MSEYIIEMKKNNTIDMPSDVIKKLNLSPGDKIVMAWDKDDEHLTFGKLPMNANEKGEAITNTIGRTIKIQ